MQIFVEDSDPVRNPIPITVEQLGPLQVVVLELWVHRLELLHLAQWLPGEWCLILLFQFFGDRLYETSMLSQPFHCLQISLGTI